MPGWSPIARGGVAFELEGGARGEASLARDGTLRLRAAAAGRPLPDLSAALERTPWEPAPGRPRAREDGGVELVAPAGPAGPGVRVEIDLAPFALRVRDGVGAALADLADLGCDAGGGARISLAAAASDRFFGFGEKTGPLDKRGQLLRMRTRDANLFLHDDPLYVSIPFFVVLSRAAAGSRATGVLLDVAAPSRFDVARSDPGQVRLETQAGGLDLAIFPGPTPADVLARYTARVGRAPRPPRWALGHHQSRWSYASEREVRELARQIRRRRIPTDAIHLDIDYMDGFRVFTFHPERFPDPKGLAGELAREGLRLVAIVDPGVKRDSGYGVFRRGEERDAFCRRDDGSPYALRVWPGESALPDFNRSDVRAWWAEEHRPLLDAGIAGIWNDMNEPAGWARDLRLGKLILPWWPQDTARLRQADPADPAHSLPHEEVRNLYGLQECRATDAALRAARPDARPFVLSRSGFAGIQRYAAVWTGDNSASWSQLRLSLRMLANLSLSGVPFCGADIGGFARSCTPELYARWIQLGALYPFARTHSMWGKRRQEPWRFGPRVEAIARAALELRMQLLPYLYGLFCEAEATGAPPWRPLFFEFPDDPESAAVEDQVMLGPALLAAPVMVRGAREREVYLPPGRWYAWDDDACYTGPRRVRVAAPLERLPLFARAGALVPTQSAVRHAGEPPLEPLRLEVFPGAEGTARVVEDDGESLAYLRGEEAVTEARQRRAADALRIEIGPCRGAWRPPRDALVVVVRGTGAPRALRLDGAPLAAGEGAPGWRSAQGRIAIRLPQDGAAHDLELEPAP